ncbi:Tsc11p [Sugiyamaella lignohabitans]|uniref:Tsc11p n=1 Tax=Sugiyamaella lignohabitans TaxID=796027 RepID=A0A161HK10_9ASCO|nr:Tsc11p [Sugiyamaella lignohabitans]ANB11878.1 Tsc11p [Sugiyamaella lignohabitans]
MSRVPDSRNEIIGLPHHRSGDDQRNNGSRIDDILAKLEIEEKIKEGAENLLEVFDKRKIKGGDKEEIKKQVESQLDAANAKIQLLQQQLGDLGVGGQVTRDGRRSLETRRSIDDLRPLTRTGASRSTSDINGYGNGNGTSGIGRSDTEIAIPEGIEIGPGSDRSGYRENGRGISASASSTGTKKDSILGVNGDLESEDHADADEDLRSGQESPTWSLEAILHSLDPSQPSEFLVQRSNDLVELLQRHPVLKYDLVMSRVGDKIRVLLLHKKPEVIASGYRLARNAITDMSSIRDIRSLHIDFMIVRTMTKDSKSQLERLQAVRLVRSFLDVPGGVDEISIGVIRALVAVSEQSDDKLRYIAIETLGEIFIKNPEKVSASGGIRVLLQSIIEGPYELSGSLSMAFAYVLDSPKNRGFLRGGRDLEYLISAMTESQVRGHVNLERLQNGAKVISSLLRTWSGLFATCIDNFYCLKSLVLCLEVPIPSLRDVLLDIFLSILCIKPLSWSSSFLAGRRLTTFGRIPDLEKELANGGKSFQSSFSQSSGGGGTFAAGDYSSRYIDHYSALLLSILVECNLIESLVQLLRSNDDVANTRKATLLLGEILSMTSRVSPPATLRRIGALPGLLESAMDHKSAFSSASSAAVFQIDKISRNLHKGRQSTITGRTGPVSEVPSLLSSKRKAVRVKMGVQIDDASFKQLIMETQVLNTKTFVKWNWDALSELIQGPLLNPKRLDEAIKTTKFMKRLMSFYRPFKYRFSAIKRTKPNQKYIDVGKSLLLTLLYNPEGVRYLTENKLLRQIAECLAQLDPMSGITSAEPLFSRQRLENTLSHGYFMLLGTLSSDPNGLAMMERWRMFNMFYHLSEIPDREDLIISFIASMDYNLVGHPRIILSKALRTGQLEVRLFATGYLQNLMGTESETQKWAIELLATQLYDPSIEVCKLAVQILENFCSINENLEHFVKMKPSFDHLGDIGTPLLLRFLSTSRGFQYLKELDYVHNEMDNWVHGQNDAFVLQIEEYLENANNLWIHDKFGLSSTATATGLLARDDGTGVGENKPPRHFFGELTITEEGCHLLQSKGHFDVFAEYIDQHKFEEEDGEILTKLKGCMWAVAHIGSNPRGVPFLEESGVVENMIKIFESSQLYSLRGTAFFCLGLVSLTYEGVEILDEMGWACVRDIMDEPCGICIPKSLQSSFDESSKVVTDAPVTTYQSPSSSSESLDTTVKESLPQTSETIKNEKTSNSTSQDDETEFPMVYSDPIKRRIITALSNLSNQILANDASKQLVRLEAKYGSRFQSIDLFLDTMKLLETYHYKLPVRRFIFELFDTTTLMERMARKQKEQQRRARHLSDTTKRE